MAITVPIIVDVAEPVVAYIKALNDEIGRLSKQLATSRITLPCDDDCYHAPMCVRWDPGTFDQEESDRGDAFEDRRQAPPGAIT